MQKSVYWFICTIKQDILQRTCIMQNLQLMNPQIAAFGYLSLSFLIFPYLWLPLIAFPYHSLPLVTFGYLWLPFLTFGYLSSPYLALFCICAPVSQLVLTIFPIGEGGWKVKDGGCRITSGVDFIDCISKAIFSTKDIILNLKSKI